MTVFFWYLCQAEVTAEVQKLKEANKQLDADLSAARQEASSQVSFAEYSLFYRALSQDRPIILNLSAARQEASSQVST